MLARQPGGEWSAGKPSNGGCAWHLHCPLHASFNLRMLISPFSHFPIFPGATSSTESVFWTPSVLRSATVVGVNTKLRMPRHCTTWKSSARRTVYRSYPEFFLLPPPSSSPNSSWRMTIQSRSMTGFSTSLLPMHFGPPCFCPIPIHQTTTNGILGRIDGSGPQRF